MKQYSTFKKKPPTAFLTKARTPLKRGLKGLRRTKLRIVGHSTTSELKVEIQALLRQIVIIRDGGCWLRHFSQSGACGGYRNDGELILQAEHLHTRSNAASFSDSRLVVCICKRHHIYWKPQYSDLYNKLARDFIGKERSELWDKVRDDWRPHKIDLKLEKLALEQELKALQKENRLLRGNSKIKNQDNRTI